MNKEKKSSRVVMLIIDALIAAVLLVLDQFTKHLAVVHLKNQPAYVIIDGVLELQYLENRGSAFGMLQNQKVFILYFLSRRSDDESGEPRGVLPVAV